MTRATDDRPVDERLAFLVQAERDLEARVRAAEEQGRAMVEAAREEGARRGEEDRNEIEEAARLEEETALREHAERLREIAGGAARTAERIRGIPDDTLESIARRVVSRVLEGRAGR